MKPTDAEIESWQREVFVSMEAHAAESLFAEVARARASEARLTTALEGLAVYCGHPTSPCFSDNCEEGEESIDHNEACLRAREALAAAETGASPKQRWSLRELEAAIGKAYPKSDKPPGWWADFIDALAAAEGTDSHVR